MAGPTLDIESAPALTDYLRFHRHVPVDATPRITTLAGGVSNKTVLVELRDGRSWVLKQALPKLRVAVDWFSDPARIRREAEALRHLPRLAPPDTITPLVFEDAGQNLLAMQAVPRPHENFKSLLLAGRVEPDHVRQFAALLATIHRRSHELRASLEPVFADRQFFESLRLEPYYEFAATQVPEAAPFLRQLIADTLSQRISIVHGDYSPKNVLVYAGRLILLDHEVIHFGDPAFDVGFALTHLLSKGHHLPDHREAFHGAAREFWHTYTTMSAFPGLEARSVRHTLAILLARTAGRSPLEYLGNEERAAHRARTLQLIRELPASLPDLIDRFLHLS